MIFKSLAVTSVSLLLGFALTAQPKAYPSPEESGLNFLWPTDASYELTSSFAEYRATHYHYGIDIKTWNKIGYDVYASEDGYVSRIRVNPTGYGKAIYLTHKNGYVTVYGHLNGFNGKIKKFVEEQHYKLKKNELNIFLNPKDIVVRRGELIAFSGETGVGTPHLHWEIRDPLENELNPMLYERALYSDKVRPTITKIAIKPINLNSTINGQPNTFIISDFKNSSDTLFSSTIPAVSGTVGILLDGYDLSDGGFNKFGFHRVELFIDKNPIYKIEYEHFPIEDAKYILVERDAELLAEGKGRFTRLFQKEENPLPFYTVYNNNYGQIKNLTTGKHELIISTEDVSGNKKSAKFYFTYHDNGKSNLVSAQLESVPVRQKLSVADMNLTTDISKIKLNDLSGFQNFYKFHPPLSNGFPEIENITYSVDDEHLRVSIFGKQISQKLFSISVKNGALNLKPDNIIPDSDLVHVLYPVERELAASGFQICITANDQAIWTDDIPFSFVSTEQSAFLRLKSGTQIIIPRSTFFADAWISVEENSQYIKQKDYQVRFGPNSIPFKNSLQIKLPLPDNLTRPEKAGLYSVKKNDFGFQGGKVSDGWLTASIGGMGLYTILEDVIPPSIEKPSVPKKGFRQWPEKLKIKISDTLSGIDSKSIIVRVNGKWTLVEFDAEEDFITVPTDRFINQKKISVSVSVSDLSDNTTSKTFSIKLTK